MGELEATLDSIKQDMNALEKKIKEEYQEQKLDDKATFIGKLQNGSIK